MTAKKVILSMAFVLSALVFAQEAEQENLTPINTNQLAKSNICVEYVDYNGGVLLYSVNASGKKIPVLDTVEYGASSFIGVQIDRQLFNLSSSGGVKYEKTMEKDSLKVLYRIKNNVCVEVVYSIPNDNLLNIKYTVKNLDSTTHSVSLKAIFDTILNEWRGGVYSTAAKSKINTEYIISDFDKHKHVSSSDGITRVNFLLDKACKESAYKVVIAAKPFFETNVFEGRFTEGRGFNTVLSYNNSCVGFFFRSVTLAKDEEKSFSQNIYFVKDPDSVDVEAHEDSHSSLKSDEAFYTKESSEKGIPAAEEKENEVSVEQPVEQASDSEPVEEEVPVKEVVSSEKKDESVVEEKVEQNDAVDKTVDIKDLQLKAEEITAPKQKHNVDKVYAMELIKKIEAIDENGKNVDRAELIRLHRELNHILMQLK